MCSKGKNIGSNGEDNMGESMFAAAESLQQIGEALNTVYLDGEMLYIENRALQNTFARINSEALGFHRENGGALELCYICKGETQTLSDKLKLISRKLNNVREDILAFSALIKPAEKRSREMRESAKRNSTVYVTSDYESPGSEYVTDNANVSNVNGNTCVESCSSCNLPDCVRESNISLNSMDREVSNVVDDHRELIRYEDFSNDSFDVYKRM